MHSRVRLSLKETSELTPPFGHFRVAPCLGKVHAENLGSVLPPGPGWVPGRQCLLRVEPNTLGHGQVSGTRGYGDRLPKQRRAFIERLLYAARYIGSKAQKFSFIFSVFWRRDLR